MDIFKLTGRPSESLFYKRKDPNDRRIGEWVVHDPKSYPSARTAIVGCPQDEGVRRNRGRGGARLAPSVIRGLFHRLPVSAEMEGHRLFDLGDVKVGGSLEQVHERQEAVVARLLKDGKRVIVFGGGNDLSYPDASAAAKREKDLSVFNIDAHYDVRADRPRNSGTSYRMLLEEGRVDPSRLHEVAGQPNANSAVYHAYLKSRGVKIASLEDLRKGGVAETFHDIVAGAEGKALFFGFDMDSVRACDAPGVSAPSPIGLTGEEAAAMARTAGRDKRSLVWEVTEVNPEHDVDHRTCRLAALTAWNFVQGVVEAGG